MTTNRIRRVVLSVACAAASAAALAPSAQALITVSGSPMRVFVGESGRLQANLAGSESNLFFPPRSPNGNAGFFLGFPAAFGDLAAGTVAGPGLSSDTTFVPVAQSAVTGAGTAASPLRQLTGYTVTDGTNTLARVTQQVTVVNGERRFRVLYAVQNASALPVRFRASTGADLYLEGSDTGTGFFSAGPPRLVGGINDETGAAGGLEENLVSGLPRWSHFQEGPYGLVFQAIRDVAGQGMTDTIDSTSVDNGAGVQWDDHYSPAAALAPGATAAYAVNWTFGSPPAKLGTTANVEVLAGTVLVSLPPSASAASRARSSQVKGRTFIPLQQARQIPVGSLLDTRKGKIRLTTATTAGNDQSGEFSAGVFQVLQSRKASSKGLTELRLKGSSFRRCPRASRRSSASARSARTSRRRIRRLSGNANGRFRTRGRYSSATVRGTIWTVTDRCDGTLTKVSRGRVTVRDLRRRKNVTVRAGKRYLARKGGR